MKDNPNVSRAYASLRLMGKHLDPGRVTARLGIKPSDAHRAGEPRGQERHWRTGYWALCSQGRVQSTDLALHIEWLLEQVEPARAQLEELLGGGIRADVFCFWESLTGHGGPSFAPDLLRRLAALDLELGLDIYFAT